MHPWETLGRRALLRGGLRYATLAGLATLAAVLWKKHQDAGPGCTNQGLCRGCSALSDCRLPLAIQHKKVQPKVSS
ncbi:hypothetical protein ACFL6U_32140 [Planctomycetota bacterium]